MKPFKVVRMTQGKHCVSKSQFTTTLNFRTKNVHGQLVHLRKVARVIFSKKHLRKTVVGYKHDLLETLQEMNIAKWGEQTLQRMTITCHDCIVKEDLFQHISL
jgi:hypothetical protein